MIKKILIANRGEIALRIVQVARELGLISVAVYSDADKNSLPVKYADEAYHIGEAEAGKSYLDIGKIIDVAKRSSADAIHPGYGFLAENPDLALACEQNGIIFVGPSSAAMRLLGDKVNAKTLARSLGVPLLPGTLDPVHDLAEARIAADDTGFPIVFKAVAGGGGHGIRIVKTPAELSDAFEAARREALAAFGNPDVYVEKWLESPRHIEVQVLADSHGQVLHFFERECSLQRRFQKLIEECPSPTLAKGNRERILDYAVRLAKAGGYTNSGTFEFLFDGEGNCFFIEANTRIQVEHPITEMVTGANLIEWQIRIASGMELPFRQRQIKMEGHALEVRVYSEDASRNFAPSTGKVMSYMPPFGTGIRVHSALYPGACITPHYDALVAKVIAWGATRESAIQRMHRALSEFVITGITTTIPFCRRILEHEKFLAADYNTRFIDTELGGTVFDDERMVPFFAAVVEEALSGRAEAAGRDRGQGSRPSAWALSGRAGQMGGRVRPW